MIEPLMNKGYLPQIKFQYYQLYYKCLLKYLLNPIYDGQCGHLKYSFSQSPDLFWASDLHVQMTAPSGFLKSTLDTGGPKQNPDTSTPAVSVSPTLFSGSPLLPIFLSPLT